MKPFALLLSTALASTLSVSMAFAEQQPVATVTLSTSGLGEYTRPVPYASEGMTTEIVARLNEMDDVLKSLVILGKDIESASLTVGSSQALNDVFETLPFSPSDLSEPGALLSRLPGVMIRVTNKDGVIEGRVMGVAQDAPCGSEGKCPAVVMVLTDEGGLERMALWDDVEFEILDEETRESIARGLNALADHGSETTRTVVVNIVPSEGSEGNPVLISTVLPAPIWKPAYRGVIGQDGGIDLQAWAVVENASGEDWNDVVLTLTSGNPQTLDANLYARTYGNRPSADDAMMVRQALMSAGSNAFSARGASESMMMDSAAPMMEMAQMAPKAQVSEGDAGARFVFDEPVSIDAGEVASVPFLGGALDARMVGYHLGGSSRGSFAAPERVLDVKNTLDVRLPPGIATLYSESEGYLGDANIPEIHAQEQRVLPFGTETRLRVRETVQSSDRETNISISDGVLIIRSEQVMVTQYDLVGPASGQGEVIVDHPLKEGYTFSKLTGGDFEKILLNRSNEVYRFSEELDADEEVEISVRESRPIMTRYQVSDLSDDQLVMFESRTADTKTKRFFNGLIQLRRVEGAASRALSTFEQERDALVQEQNRLSGLMENMAQGSDAHNRFSNAIVEIEDQLSDMNAEGERLRQALNRARAETRDFINAQ